MQERGSDIDYVFIPVSLLWRFGNRRGRKNQHGDYSGFWAGTDSKDNKDDHDEHGFRGSICPAGRLPSVDYIPPDYQI